MLVTGGRLPDIAGRLPGAGGQLPAENLTSDFLLKCDTVAISGKV
jgi:hypothetical protein